MPAFKQKLTVICATSASTIFRSTVFTCTHYDMIETIKCNNELCWSACSAGCTATLLYMLEIKTPDLRPWQSPSLAYNYI
jgi:hypothetical protein